MRAARRLLLSIHAVSLLLFSGTWNAGAAQSVPDPTASVQSVTVPSPNLAGVAHVALRVQDLDASIRFYEELGFIEAFALSREGKVYEAFLKVNDRQFIELYPVTKAGPGAEFLHVCFEANDLQAVHDFYVKAGLTPTSVKLAGAGNLLFTMTGPATPTGPQNMEYTQYRPGSLHTKDASKHLGSDRIATEITGIALAANDPKAARKFYIEKAGFLHGRRGSVRLPGVPQESLQIVPSQELGVRARILFSLHDPAATQAVLAKRSMQFQKSGSSLILLDPDGNQVVLAR